MVGHKKHRTDATANNPALMQRVEVLFGRLLALDFTTDHNDMIAVLILPPTVAAKTALQSTRRCAS